MLPQSHVRVFCPCGCPKMARPRRNQPFLLGPLFRDKAIYRFGCWYPPDFLLKWTKQKAGYLEKGCPPPITWNLTFGGSWLDHFLIWFGHFGYWGCPIKGICVLTHTHFQTTASPSSSTPQVDELPVVESRQGAQQAEAARPCFLSLGSLGFRVRLGTSF